MYTLYKYLKVALSLANFAYHVKECQNLPDVERRQCYARCIVDLEAAIASLAI